MIGIRARNVIRQLVCVGAGFCADGIYLAGEVEYDRRTSGSGDRPFPTFFKDVVDIRRLDVATPGELRLSPGRWGSDSAPFIST